MDDFGSEITPNKAISVTELNRTVRTLLERGIGRVWVEGEISNLARPGSGHFYFSMKDSGAQVRCAWFRQRQRGPTINLKDGDKMLALGRVSVYEARGDYQLIVERLEPAGEGELRRRFEELKKKLSAEGLFDESLKKPLPDLPRSIGVITSPTGAAIRDILSVLKRRFPAVPVIIYPVAVQGDAAVPEITTALSIAARRSECDVLIVGRGGGSLEDLWAFNEEAVARAISACPIPVVSAVGHEVDVTIADLVADLRAPTPSGAAEIIVPDQLVWQRNFDATLSRFSAQMRRILDVNNQSVDWLARRLAQSNPGTTVARQGDQLGRLRKSLVSAMRHNLVIRQQTVDRLASRLRQQSPASAIQQKSYELLSLQQRLRSAGSNKVSVLNNRLSLAARAMHSVSPLATLDRGYAIVTDIASGKALTDSADVRVGTEVEARLSRGRLLAVVSTVHDNEET